MQSPAPVNPPRADSRMREDWNRRAREDAYYYVAFGKHGQDDTEFHDTAHEIVYGLEYELRRLPRDAGPGSLRALEIGCGPGRLMKPLSRHFAEIHGVDVSDEMVQLARERLHGTPNAHVHTGQGSDLRQFDDESFDFVYSYAVFQHIPSREIVESYWAEARRVLKTGGLFWFQVNGLPADDLPVNTWSGVRYEAREIAAFANRNDFQMYTLEGVNTQYMWTSLRKRPRGWFTELAARPPETSARIRRISNPHGTEPGVPCAGRFSVASLWIENPHPECGLNHLRVFIDGVKGTPNYIAPVLNNGQQQFNVVLPAGVATGLIPVRMEWLGRQVGDEAIVRIVPPSPCVPRLLSVSDATDLLSGPRILTRSIKAVMEELADPADARFSLNGIPLSPSIIHWADRRTPRVEFVLPLPESIPSGAAVFQVEARRQKFPAITLDVVLEGMAQGPY
ncbi:MAG: class I SAM-dependent methyltransferase [Candidatus Solibacter usitatus]|nr:class I SAM-dependent methyltransferase [Candidatus Solibacter usitatus]